jgi:hypothetical protein
MAAERFMIWQQENIKMPSLKLPLWHTFLFLAIVAVRRATLMYGEE